MENVPSPFLTFWNNAMIVGAIIMFVAGISIYIAHKLRFMSLQDYKTKYDYLNMTEIKHYRLMFIFFGLGVAMIINLYGSKTLTEMGLWFFMRILIAISGGTLVAYVAHLVLVYYYPTVLSKKLKKWRYMPRTNPTTGNLMRLLSEEEEDVHLEAGMQAEENAFSIDYDVWVDEKTNEVKIEKYPGRLQALQCNSCGFYTMRITKEEITKQPGNDEPGELVKYYQCTYCKSTRATAFNISTKEPEDYQAMSRKSMFRKNKGIDLVRIEIHSNLSGRKFFEFQNTDQAQKFLGEYEDQDENT